MMLRTKSTVPNFLADAAGHPQVVTVMAAVFGGGAMRHGQAGLATVNGLPTLLSFGEVWTSGTCVQ